MEGIQASNTYSVLCTATGFFSAWIAQKWTLLAQAYEWERLAITDLEAHFIPPNTASPWEMAAAA
jgi:hypothetical protein